MPSPFPGMDPYLELSWRDVHASLIIYVRDSIQDALPPALHARVEERVVLELPEGLSGRGLYPDARIIEQRADRTPAPAGVLTATPALICEAGDEPITEGYIEVIDAGSGNKVVTLIEILSPTNKLPGVDRDAYREKQRSIVRSDTNLVEIDLVRAGKHVVAVPAEMLPDDRRTRNMACVRRATVPRKAEVYPIFLNQRLPVIKIPLRPGDEDVVLDLQPLVDQVYQRGRYAQTIDYNKSPDPPFDQKDESWADDLLRKAGVRTAPAKGKRKRRKPDRE